MTATPHKIQEAEIRALLGPVRAQLTSSIRRRAIMRAARIGLAITGVLACATLSGLAIAYVRHTPAPGWFLPVMAALLAAALLVAIVRAHRLVRSLRPSWRDVAERLDLAGATHNQIATALDLLRQSKHTGFASAAIVEGSALLSQAAHRAVEAPRLPAQHVRTELIAATLTSLAILLAAVGRGSAGDAPSIIGNPPMRSGLAQVGAVPPRSMDQGDSDHHLEEMKSPPQSSGPRVIVESNPTHSETSGASKESRAAQSNTSGSTATQANTLIASAPTSGASGALEAKASRTPPSVPPRRAAKQPHPKDASSPAAAPGDQSAMAIPGGNASGGTIKAVAGRTSVREAPPAVAAEEMDDPGAIEETTSSNDQRGGIQPSLPDRTAAPSRELGITGPKSKRPGTGRGGPSPLKKSRGTAALLMGVPVPDFVFGKVGPGPVATTVENSTPQQRDSVPVPPTQARSRIEAESPIAHRAVPWSSAGAVTRYLETWHGRDRAGDAPATTEPSPTDNPEPGSGTTP